MKNSISQACKSGLGAGKSNRLVTLAFTRVELMTVLAVLALMGLLLLPALARSRVNDHAFQCQANLRQLINGWRMYAADNADRLPDAFSWMHGALYYDGHPDNTNVALIKQSLLWPYVNSLPVFKCPADRSLSGPPTGMIGMPRTRTYSMSQAFRGQNHQNEHWNSPPWRIYQKTSDMVKPPPSKLWVFLEENPDSVNDAAFAVNMNNAPAVAAFQDGPGMLHANACCFGFADGHFEIHKWKDARTYSGPMATTYIQRQTYTNPKPNNPDIEWLKSRTTAKY